MNKPIKEFNTAFSAKRLLLNYPYMSKYLENGGFDSQQTIINGDLYTCIDGTWECAGNRVTEYERKYEPSNSKCMHKNRTVKMLLTSSYEVCDDCGEEI